jgi:hypothetical protein
MACEKCWGDAYLRSLHNGKTQSDNYRELLDERKDNPCILAEERGCECLTPVMGRLGAFWTCCCGIVYEFKEQKLGGPCWENSTSSALTTQQRPS